MSRAPRALSPPERLRLLLPWINGEAVDDRAVRNALVTFLVDFHTPHFRVHADAMTYEAHAWATTKELAATRAKVLDVLGRAQIGGEPPAWLDEFDREGPDDIQFEDIEVSLACPSLRFGVRPGAEPELHVDARRVRDLVAFLLLHLLTLGEVTVGVCDAPTERKWKRRCNQVFVQNGHGRPRRFCSDACRRRHFDKRKDVEERRKLRESTRIKRGEAARRTTRSTTTHTTPRRARGSARS